MLLFLTSYIRELDAPAITSVQKWPILAFFMHLAVALCDICWPYISVFCSHCAWCLNSCGLWRDVDRAVLKRCWRVLFSHSWMELRLDWVNCTVHWMIYETSARGTHKHVLRCPLMLFCQVPAWPNSSYSHQKPL